MSLTGRNCWSLNILGCLLALAGLIYLGQAITSVIPFQTALAGAGKPGAAPADPPLSSAPGLQPAPPSPPPPAESCDVLVVGADPEGIAAAIGAARSGARVILLDGRDRPGGLFVHGMLNVLDMSFGPRGELLTRGVFEEFFRQIKGEAFDTEQAAQIFTRLIERESRIRYLPQAKFLRPEMDATGQAITGVRVLHQGRERLLRGRIVIDATQDADVAAAAGAPFTLGGGDYGHPALMAATLILHIGNVDWQVLTRDLRASREPMRGVNRTTAWGYEREMRLYQPSTAQLRVRGLNIGLQNDGSVLLNFLLIYLTDYLDPAARQQGLELGRAEAPAIVAHLRQHVPGFSQARLVGVAPELYVRETRHIVGEYRLTINDVLGNRMFDDRIALGSYPADVQTTSPSIHGICYGKPAVYAIPYRSLVPLKVENLLVTGRSASYTSLAAASTRVVPVGMATGQAAGVAAAYGVRHGLTPREIARRAEDVRRVQQELKGQGAHLEEYRVAEAASSHWAYSYLQFFRLVGIAAGGYHNQWHLDDPITVRSFLQIAKMAGHRSGAAKYGELEKALAAVPHDAARDNEPIGKELALRLLAALHDARLAQAPLAEIEKAFSDQGLMSPLTASRWQQASQVSRGLAYALIYDTLARVYGSQMAITKPAG